MLCATRPPLAYSAAMLRVRDRDLRGLGGARLLRELVRHAREGNPAEAFARVERELAAAESRLGMSADAIREALDGGAHETMEMVEVMMLDNRRRVLLGS